MTTEMTTVDEQVEEVGVVVTLDTGRMATMYECHWADYPGIACDIPVADITVLPEDNGRYSTALAGDKRLKSLMDSIESNGQDTPVKVRLLENGMPCLVYGFRRVAAIASINLGRKPKDQMTVRCELATEADGTMLSDANAFIKNAIENLQREDLTPIDQLGVFERLAKPVTDGGFGMSQGDIAKTLGVSRPTVNMYLKNLSPLSAKSKKAIHERKVGAFAIVELMTGDGGLTPEQADAEIEKMIEAQAAGGKKLSTREAKAKSRKSKDSKAEATGKGKQRTIREIVGDLTEEVVKEDEQVSSVKAPLLAYVQGKMKFDTMVKKIVNGLAG